MDYVFSDEDLGGHFGVSGAAHTKSMWGVDEDWNNEPLYTAGFWAATERRVKL